MPAQGHGKSDGRGNAPSGRGGGGGYDKSHPGNRGTSRTSGTDPEGRDISAETRKRKNKYGKGPGQNTKLGVATSLLWEFKNAQTSFVEGHEPELRYGEPGGSEMISPGEFKKRTEAYNAQQNKWNTEMAARNKIKPIKDPDATVTDSRKRATRRKGRGRAGTLLSQNETLG